MDSKEHLVLQIKDEKREGYYRQISITNVIDPKMQESIDAIYDEISHFDFRASDSVKAEFMFNLLGIKGGNRNSLYNLLNCFVKMFSEFYSDLLRIYDRQNVKIISEKIRTFLNIYKYVQNNMESVITREQKEFLEKLLKEVSSKLNQKISEIENDELVNTLNKEGIMAFLFNIFCNPTFRELDKYTISFSETQVKIENH